MSATLAAVAAGIFMWPLPMTESAGETMCSSVVHVGDSTSVGLMSRMWLRDPLLRLPARYTSVGVGEFIPEISGARSMVETRGPDPNATTVVKTLRASGYRGCWVLALGTNDPANLSGDVRRLGRRIDTMMNRVGGLPVLWTTTKTRKRAGPYRNEHMVAWNKAVTDACARHPNMRVYDWASEVEDRWFQRDGIHFNAEGNRERSMRFAKAVATAFPKAGAPPATCVVRAGR